MSSYVGKRTEARKVTDNCSSVSFPPRPADRADSTEVWEAEGAYVYGIHHVFYLRRENYGGKLNLHLWRTIWIPDPDMANFYVYSYLERSRRWWQTRVSPCLPHKDTTHHKKTPRVHSWFCLYDRIPERTNQNERRRSRQTNKKINDLFQFTVSEFQSRVLWLLCFWAVVTQSIMVSRVGRNKLFTSWWLCGEVEKRDKVDPSKAQPPVTYFQPQHLICQQLPTMPTNNKPIHE